MTKLLALSKKYNDRISATAGPLAEARGWREMERARREGWLKSRAGIIDGMRGIIFQDRR